MHIRQGQNICVMKNVQLQIADYVLDAMKSTNINDIKVKSIVDDLHISRSTFYRYYDSAYDVLQAIEDRYLIALKELSASVWSYPVSIEYFSTPHPVFLKVMNYIYENKKVAKVLFGIHGDQLFSIRCKNAVKNNLFPISVMKYYYPKDTELHIEFLIGGHIELLHYWQNSDCDMPIDEFTIKSYRLLFSDLVFAKSPPYDFLKFDQ